MLWDFRSIDTVEAALLPGEGTALLPLRICWDTLSIPETGQSVERQYQPAANPLSHVTEMQMIFYDTIDILFLVYQFSLKIKEYLNVINDRWRNLN